MYAKSIAEAAQKFKTVDDILNTPCATCKMDLYVRRFHIGGYAIPQPFVTCSNPVGGWTPEHCMVRITDELAFEYQDFTEWQEVEFGCWQEERGDYPEEAE